MYQIKELNKIRGLFHVFSTIDDGNMSFKFGNQDVVVQGRSRFLRANKIDINKTVCLKVFHSNKIVEAKELHLGSSVKDHTLAPKADVLVTNQKNVYLMLLVADCLPIILFDATTDALGLVHAGRKGTDLKISTKAVLKLTKLYNAEPKKMIAAIGPGIRKESYIKSNPSQKNDKEWKDFIEHTKGDDYRVDLVGYNKKQLKDAGLSESNLIDCRIDTGKDYSFYSHYYDKRAGDGDKGRFVCVAGMV